MSLNVLGMDYEQFKDVLKEGRAENPRAFYRQFISDNIIEPLVNLTPFQLDTEGKKLNINDKDVRDIIIGCLQGNANIQVDGESIFVTDKYYLNSDDFRIMDDSGEIILDVNGIDDIIVNHNRHLYEGDKSDFIRFCQIVSYLTDGVKNLFMFN